MRILRYLQSNPHHKKSANTTAPITTPQPPMPTPATLAALLVELVELEDVVPLGFPVTVATVVATPVAFLQTPLAGPMPCY
jgi:hypothetical protein